MPSEMNQRPVFVARPTVRVRGRQQEKVTELLLSMRMTEAEGGMSSLELRFTNIASGPQGAADFAFDDEEILALGVSIAVYGGEQDSPQEIFQGSITAIELLLDEHNPPQLAVHAEDALQKARLTRRTKVYGDASISDIAGEIARAAGLSPSVIGFSERIGTVVQIDESDLALLRRLLELHGGDLQVVGQELQVAPRSDVQRGTLTLEHGVDLVAARFAVDLADQTTEVTVTGWDAVQGARITGRSTGSSLGPGQGRTGASVLRNTLGERSEHLGQLVAVTTDTEATAAAEAAFARRARRFVRVDATAIGTPALRVGTHVRLTGLPSRWNNTYYVVRAEHRYDLVSGYRTEFEAECAYLGEA
ncbi:phage late control D family protein [Sorangium sp. So ce1389]|uniref:phage late control D family protein n=1 Tax=Sorangium sp. So ce1389 TaxID=3133336 RepID=UPI003F640972